MVDLLRRTFESNGILHQYEREDYKTAVDLVTKEYDEDGQCIECGCCYVESPFDTMVQCNEGHLFCADCLRDYAKEAAFGSGKAYLQCMTDGCEATFAFSQMQKALKNEEKILKRFEEREQDEALKLANLDNLFKCPHCEFAAVVAEEEKVFSCQNPSCMKETCMHCKEPWNEEHFGVPCKEMEKQNVTNLRTSAEEKMTAAKVRKCWRCDTIFLKSSGCNKMTCRCGAKMCYICRKPKIDYTHFCRHPREPGQECTNCNYCNLWTDPEEDDNRAIAEIQKEAEQERNKITGENVDEAKNKVHIGPSIDVKPVAQQQPRQQLPQQQHHNNMPNFQQFQQFYVQQEVQLQNARQNFNRGHGGRGGRGGGGGRRRQNRRGGGGNPDWVDVLLDMQEG